uniref:Uncharacterized protein n=1 Tax=Anopheles darlingi TaxID=43151 RepID=A0A2M4DDY3_ANODA
MAAPFLRQFHFDRVLLMLVLVLLLLVFVVVGKLLLLRLMMMMMVMRLLAGGDDHARGATVDAAAAAALGPTFDVLFLVVRVAGVATGRRTVVGMVAHIVPVVVLGAIRTMIVMHRLMNSDIYSWLVWHIVHFISGPCK